MSTIAEFTIPAQALPGGNHLAELPDLRIEVERLVPTREGAFPFFWVFGKSTEAYLEAVESDLDASLEDVRMLDRVEDGALLRAEWRPGSEVLAAVARLDPTIMEAVGTSDGWYFQVRAERREDFRSFRAVFEDAGIPVELQRLYSVTELLEGGPYPVTDVQRETLVEAYRVGYFDQPRAASQAELADRFGVSASAVSARLRRGTRNLVESVLLSPPERGEEG